jgi:hypothetical protein
MEIPVWVATIGVGAALSMVSYLIKLVFDLDKRVTRLEEHVNGKGKP